MTVTHQTVCERKLLWPILTHNSRIRLTRQGRQKSSVGKVVVTRDHLRVALHSEEVEVTKCNRQQS
jgi:hypothetical protein